MDNHVADPSIYERNTKLENSRLNDKWYFLQDENGEWRWQKRRLTGFVFGKSEKGYKNIFDCISDAYQNGYPTYQESSKSYRPGYRFFLEVEVTEKATANSVLVSKAKEGIEAFFEIKSIAPLTK